MGYLQILLFSLNGLQDGTPCVSRPVGNGPKFRASDNSLNRDILHSLRFHSALICYILDGEVTDKEEKIMCFIYSTQREIT